MLENPIRTVQQITEMHRTTVDLWHRAEIHNPHEQLLGLACQEHQFNFLLWHEEDIARSPEVSDERIAQVKRAIDGYNQQRNDAIEKIDDFLLHTLTEQQVTVEATARLNTETPGSAIDRLSIMALRIYHLHEQVDRPGVSKEHRQKVRARLELCYQQHSDLAHSLTELLGDVFAGRKRLKLYRQMKMYNDPTLNPYLYNRRRLAG